MQWPSTPAGKTAQLKRSMSGAVLSASKPQKHLSGPTVRILFSWGLTGPRSAAPSPLRSGMKEKKRPPPQYYAAKGGRLLMRGGYFSNKQFKNRCEAAELVGIGIVSPVRRPSETSKSVPAAAAARLLRLRPSEQRAAHICFADEQIK